MEIIMKKIIYIFALIGFASGVNGTQPAGQKINLGGPRDRVLPPNVRSHVLAVAETYLTKEPDAFLERIADIKNPYLFVQPRVVVATPDAPAPAPVVYDDATVLKAVAARFSTQVRGNISRGSDHFLHLQGGNLLRAGATFPARLPEIPGQTFDVIVSEIDARGYTLRLGEAERYQTFIKATDSAGASRFSEE